MLGIIGAMTEEVIKIKEAMEAPEITTVASMDFYKGKIRGKEVIVVKSGIGKVNAAICAQILVDRFGVDAIVNTGIAGSLNAKIDIGDMVLSTDALQHDMDVAVFGYQPGQVPQLDTLAFPADVHLLEVAKECCERVNSDITTYVGRVVSGDQFICDKEKKEWLVNQFGGYCTEMEGAAIAQAAYLNHVPYLIVREISDKADDSAEVDYPQFEKEAIVHSVNLMFALIEKLS